LAILNRFMVRRLLHLLFIVASSLCAQDSPISLCIVQTQYYPGIRYDLPPGPTVAEIFKQLSGKKLLDGSRLEVTALPASFEKDILPEISHVQCSWTLQLWPPPIGPYNNFYFSLWNAVTHKAIAKGTVAFPVKNPRHPIPKAADPAAAFSRQSAQPIEQTPLIRQSLTLVFARGCFRVH